MWQRVKSFCLNSVTMAVGYVVGALSLVLELVLDAANAVDSGQLKTEIATALADHPVLVARLTLVLSIIFILARLRGLLGWFPKKDSP